VGALGEYDLRSGFAGNGLVESEGENEAGGGVLGPLAPPSPANSSAMGFVPVTPALGTLGFVGSGGGGVGGFVGAPEGSFGYGGGAYVSITSVDGCS
jgi:hypothetical protein